MSGGSLVTKGLAGNIPNDSPTPNPTTLPAIDVSDSHAQLGSVSPTGTVAIVIPTAINVILLAAENINANLRARQAASLGLPSLYKRAFLVAYETDEIAVVKA